jgi:hypothetical protein
MELQTSNPGSQELGFFLPKKIGCAAVNAKNDRRESIRAEPHRHSSHY